MLVEEDRFPVRHLQDTISQRPDRSLLSLKENIGQFEKIVESFRDAGTVFVESHPEGHYVDKIPLERREKKLGLDLTEFWTKTFEKQNSSRLLLGKQLAGLLEQCIEYGLASVLTHIVPIVGIDVLLDDQPTKIRLTDVYHCPGLHYNLMSVGQVEAKGYTCSIKNGKFRFVDSKGAVALIGSRNDAGAYFVDTPINPPNSRSLASRTGPEASWRQWHKRLAHLNMADVKRQPT